VNEFWFTPKLKGYGAVPNTWEGYTLVAVFASVVLICVCVMIWREKTLSIFPRPMIVVAVSTIVFLLVCTWKTDGAWG
jgi:Co/Zn/Cd efflux system component